MDEQVLCVFAIRETTPPLRVLQQAFEAARVPAVVSIALAGPATPEDLESTDWDAVFIRWSEPEIHDVAVIERDLVGDEEEADTAIVQAKRNLARSADLGGKIIVLNHLDQTSVVYTMQVMPPLISDEDHPAWGVLDAPLRAIARNSEGVIFAEAAGFFDAEGEPIVSEDLDADEAAIYDTDEDEDE